MSPRANSLSLKLTVNIASLPERGIEQLFPDSLADEAAGPSAGHAYYLLKISKSLLLNFLELAGILSIVPEQHEPKLKDIRNLFVNAHHLLNLYRPHQSRESLIALMEEQLEKAREEIQEMDEMKAHVETYLRELEAEGRNVSQTEETIKTVEEPFCEIEMKPSDIQEEDVQQEMWKLLDELEDN